MMAWSIVGFLAGLALSMILDRVRRFKERKRVEAEWAEARKQDRYRHQG
jgi:type II secretory pathway pseudopilin PulG